MNRICFDRNGQNCLMLKTEARVCLVYLQLFWWQCCFCPLPKPRSLSAEKAGTPATEKSESISSAVETEMLEAVKEKIEAGIGWRIAEMAGK